MASTLVLVRHGKAQSRADGLIDFERPLTEAGRRSLAAHMPTQLAFLQKESGRHALTAALWTSPADRAFQTAECLADALEGTELRFDGAIDYCDALWSQDADTFLSDLADCDADVVFAVGHNPFVETLTKQLAGASLHIATGGMAAIDVSGLARGGNLPRNRQCRLLWVAQGPISQVFRTVVQLEEALSHASDVVAQRRAAFFADPDDVEAMHKLRVSIRTLRSLVAFVKPWQDKGQNQRTQQLLKEVVAETSRLRELDVFAEQARAGEDASEELVAFCEEQASRERTRVEKALRSKRLRKKLAKALKLCNHIAWRKSVTARGLESTWVRARFDKMVASLESDLGGLQYSDYERVHDVRKRAKRARYAAESFKEILGEDAVVVAKGMTAHQDNLGALCDARVNIELINGFLQGDLPDQLTWELSLLRARNETFLYSLLNRESDAPQEA